MWQDKLKEIIYLLENSEVNEIEVSFWGRKYRVVKSPSIVMGGAVGKSADYESTDSEAKSSKIIHSKPITQSNNHEKILSPMP